METTDKKEGSGGAKLVVATAATTGLSAYENLTTTADLTNQTQVSFWIKSETSTTAGQLELVLDEDAGCGSTEANIDVPALTANTWKLVTAAILQTSGTAVTNANKNAVACVGINIITDLSGSATVDLFVDEVVAVGLITSVAINVTNAVEGEPVDMTAPSDSDDNGVADSDSTHVMVITYTDKNQLVRDLYWTKVFLGDNDSDDLLETGERVELTIELKGLADATPLVKDLDYNIEIKPAIGAVLVIQRRTPAVIDTVMNLN